MGGKCLVWELLWSVSYQFFNVMIGITQKGNIMDTLLATAPIAIAALDLSIVYLLAGGGLFGAVVIFIVAKMLGR
jgi:hypothetical protein